ncbi:MAG: hypothetical protein Q9180_001474 [Flavoplaca navasiana]
MKACGNTPPINIKSLPSTRSSALSSPVNRVVDKGAYMNHERLRWARLFDVPMKETTPPVAATNAEGVVDHFWGFDNIAAVANHLGLEKPTSGNTGASGWRSML